MRVVAIASSGGHWQQLMLLREAFEDQTVLYLTTLEGLADEYGAKPFKIVPDCNRNEVFKLLAGIMKTGRIMAGFKPDVVVSTGALPGAIAIVLGRMIGAQTIWIDSVANTEELSMSGRLVKRFCHQFLTQSEAVSKESGALYRGSVL